MRIARRSFPVPRPAPVLPGLLCLLCLLVPACSPTGSPGMAEDDGEASAIVEDPTPTVTAGESENERVVRDFIAAWPRLDPEELASYFTEDGVYHNVPTRPVEGRENVEELIRGFTADWTETHWDVVHLVSEGDVVIAERVDHVTVGERSVDLPVVGVFEMEDGRIREWRDYFDLATYQRGLTGP